MRAINLDDWGTSPKAWEVWPCLPESISMQAQQIPFLPNHAQVNHHCQVLIRAIRRGTFSSHKNNACHRIPCQQSGDPQDHLFSSYMKSITLKYHQQQQVSRVFQQL